MDISTPAMTSKRVALAMHDGVAPPPAGPWNGQIELLASNRSVRG